MKPENPVAFPRAAGNSGGSGSSHNASQTGMTLRDYLAAKCFHTAWKAGDEGYFEISNQIVAECAYQFADAMLEARAK